MVELTEHEKWLIHQAKKCLNCDDDATTVIRFSHGYCTLTASYCDDHALGVREHFGSTRQKRAKHDYAECLRDEQHYLDALSDLRERYPEPKKPYVSTVGMIA